MWEGPEIQMKTCKQTNTFVNSDVSETLISLFVLDVFNLFLFSLHDLINVGVLISAASDVLLTSCRWRS